MVPHCINISEQQLRRAASVTPSPRQLAWQQLEFYGFIHFGMNTFAGREWGDGTDSPQLFHPEDLDPDQWVAALKSAGMRGLILTCKHHDGFCLWPCEGTEYSVKNSPWRNGQGNLVKELSDACRKHGLKFGIYLSPWDRNRADYGTDSYVDYYHAQWKDLMTHYGPLFEVWFDGANGGDGWYGGAKETRTIDRRTYYRLPEIYAALDSLQPQAVIFSDGGPGCRWVGNERGIAGETNWSFLRRGVVYPGYPKQEELTTGHPDGDQWSAAECDVSIRPGWFFHPEENDKVKTTEQLVDLYYKSVGRNATLLLNFPVDRDGLIHPIDSANAVNFRKEIDRQLANDLLAGLRPSVSNERGGRFTAAALTDDNYHTYWATEDGVHAATIEFALPQPSTMDCVLLQEYIPLGQRVQSFAIECRVDGRWQPVECDEQTTTIGYKRLVRFVPLKAEALRITLKEARGPLCLNRIGAFYTGN